MRVIMLQQLLLLLTPTVLAGSDTTRSPTAPLDPSHESARANAFRIFNAIHSAARQWGSSVNHNGFGFIPATMPKGTLLYHGRHDSTPPEDIEWLAFEPEHSALFARTRFFWQNGTDDGDDDADASQKPLTGPANARGGPLPFDPVRTRGYFQTFQARRDLNLLYLDGMAAAKIEWGTLDQQDVVLRGKPPGYFLPLPEEDRADELCEMVVPWGYDGIVRMEVGFEVIHCNISDSMTLISNVRTGRDDDAITRHRHWMYHHARAVAQRYQGIGADRLKLDFSSMVSGLFFPLNTTSLTPDRPDLERLGAAEASQLKGLKAYVEDVSREPRRFTVRWQAVADQIVTWLGDRLLLMTMDGVDTSVFIEEVEIAILPFFHAAPLPDDISIADFDERIANATRRCSDHFILPAALDRDEWSMEDQLIHTSVSRVTAEICETLMSVQSSLVKASQNGSISEYRVQESGVNDDALKRAVEAAKCHLKALMERLAWPIWQMTRPCPPDQLMYIAMWPFGDPEDHWNPGCRTLDEISDYRRFGYFHPDLVKTRSFGSGKRPVSGGSAATIKSFT